MRAIVLAVALAAATSAAAAEHPWVASFQAGNSTLHDWEPGGGWAEARVGRSFAAGLLSADVGLAGSTSDEGYAALTAGFEVLPLPRAIVSPFARAEAGVVAEPEYVGYLLSVGGGLSVRLSERLSLRGGASWGTHGDVAGPTVYYGGVQLRW